MKALVLLALCISVLLISGCTSSPAGVNAGETLTANPGSDTANPAFGQSQRLLKMNDPVILKNGTRTVSASISRIDSIDKGAGNHLIDIYMTVLNTGTEPIQMTWYSTLTDKKGKSYGGIGVSHGGDGAVTREIGPGYSATARDYILINSDSDYAALANGAILDVAIFGATPGASASPQFQTSWIISPAFFK